MVFVAAASGRFDQSIGGGTVCEPLGIQRLVSQPSLEALVQAVLPRLIRLDACDL